MENQAQNLQSNNQPRKRNIIFNFIMILLLFIGVLVILYSYNLNCCERNYKATDDFNIIKSISILTSRPQPQKIIVNVTNGVQTVSGLGNYDPRLTANAIAQIIFFTIFIFILLFTLVNWYRIKNKNPNQKNIKKILLIGFWCIFVTFLLYRMAFTIINSCTCATAIG